MSRVSLLSTHVRRPAVAVCAAGALCLVTALSGSAAAVGSKGVKGDPQPELKPFTIGPSSGQGGTVAVEPGGGLVAVYTNTTDTAVKMCVLARAGHSCTLTHTFTPSKDDSLFGVPQVFAPAANDIVLLMGAGDVHGDLVFTSTDGGKTFTQTLVGNDIIPTSAVLIGDQIAYTENDDSNGVRVAAISATTPAPPPSLANPSMTEGTVGIGSYKGGVLVAGDNADGGPTSVEYAPSGDDFNTTSSYTNVGSFAAERVVAMSGSALMTVQTGGKAHLEVRLFNGTHFGAAHAVPGGGEAGPESFTIDQDPSGVTHVFRSDDRTTPIYEVNEYSTTTGAHWSAAHHLGGALSNFFTAALDKTGSGLVLGLQPAKGYPVLAQQSVTFSLKKSKVKKGHKTTGSGKGHAAAHGRKVELQVEKSGRWYDVKSTHESSSGAFKFSIKGSKIGKFHYRAVASDHAGYVEFGYSAARTLTVKK